MSVEIILPKLSDTMEEGTILKWLKKEGDRVACGEVIAEVETDKADMELEASDEGVLATIKVQAGVAVPVGTVIGVLEAADGTKERRPAPAAEAMASGETAEPARAAVPQGDARAEEAGEGAGAAPESAPPPPRRKAAAATPARYDGAAHPAGDPKASAEARRLAADTGVDLRRVQGSGPSGRIVREDVEAHVKGGGAETVPPDAAPSRRGLAARADGGGPTTERQQLSRMRQSIARRMSEAFRDVPHFYVTSEIDMTEAVHLKAALQASELFETPITYTHMVLKATALALRRHPRLNASFVDEAIELKGDVNLGMAVAVEDGLIVPVLRHADELGLEEIAREARRLVEQAKQGRFASDDLSGGTFTVSNMGMLDIEHFTAVINPPQAAILAVGAIKERAVVRNGALAVAATMHVTVSCDHRVIDGVIGGRFLEELKRLLENPLVLVLRAR